MNLKLSSIYKYEQYRDDKLIWSHEEPNLVVDQGLDYAMNILFGHRESLDPDFYCGLITGTTLPVRTDTMASHGFTEFVDYTHASRKAAEFQKVQGEVGSYISDGVSQFYITKPSSIKGAFLTTSPTKDGDDGYLYGASTFATSRNLKQGDLLVISIKVIATG